MQLSNFEGQQIEQEQGPATSRSTEKPLRRFVASVDAAMRRYTLFTICFSVLALTEAFGLLFSFAFLLDASLLAASLAVLFLTLFSFLILRLFFSGRKADQLASAVSDLTGELKALIDYQEGIPEHHLFLANGLTRAVTLLQDKEQQKMQPPEFLEVLGPVSEQVACWWYWADYHQTQELLLKMAIAEHVCLVKCEPTNLEVHAGLANAYVLLSRLYAPPKSHEVNDEDRWIPKERLSEEMDVKFRQTAQRAIEEFKILNAYAPDDPWIHAQLAYSYHDMGMPEEEIREYETILRLRPDDLETQVRLGRLYFQMGHNANGLQIYEQVKRSHYKHAENLITFYGSQTID